MVEPSRWVIDLGEAGEARHAGKPASSLRNAVSSRSGLRPGWSRRYALSRSVSPSTTEVLRLVRPEGALRARRVGGQVAGRARGRAGHTRAAVGPRTRVVVAARSAAIVRPSAIATASARHARRRAPRPAGGRPVRARRVARHGHRRRAGRRSWRGRADRPRRGRTPRSSDASPIGPALGAEPAAPRRPRRGRAPRSPRRPRLGWDRRRQPPVLIITCLTNV